MLVATFVLLAFFVLKAACRGPHHPRGEKIIKHHVHYSPSKEFQGKLTQDQELLRDIEHIQVRLFRNQ